MSRPGRRAGVSNLEIQMALVILGIALAGICPMIAMQVKLLRRIEARSPAPGTSATIRGQRLVDGVPAVPQGEDPSPPVAVLHAHPDPWVRRLGLAATIDDQVAMPTLVPIPTEATYQETDAVLDGSWTEQEAADASMGSFRSLAAGGTPGSAAWTFGAIAPATYRVLLSWPTSVTIPPDARMTLIDGAGDPATVPIPPRATPDAGPWLDLGNLRLGPTTTLRLGRSSLSAVVADAVRIGARNQVTLAQPLAADMGSNGGYTARVKVVARP